VTAKRELNIKPSCAHELHAFPAKQAAQLWEKIGYLIDNPLPDGKLKKKLNSKQDLFRLRVGDYRVFYTFGDTWIRLLAIRKRDDQTYGKSNEIEADEPGSLPTDGDDFDADADERRLPKQVQVTSKAPASAKLPRNLSAAWLESLKIPGEHIATLVLCKTEDQLLAAPVPADVLDRVVDNLWPKPIEEVLQQPDLLVQTTSDLVKFKEGSLFSFLLRLDPDQERLTTWALKGPTLVKGGAGTGKSTVALYRLRSVLRRPDATGKERVLFTTYTRALETVSRQLLEQLLTPAEMERVRVATVDELVNEVVRKARKLGPIEPKPQDVLDAVRATFTPSGPSPFEQKLRARSLAKIATRYLLDEFEWIIEGRAIAKVEEYEETARPGRGVKLGAKMRAAVWELYRAYQTALQKQGRETFPSLRREAATLVTASSNQSLFDYVLVDEAQDLAPASLRFLAHLARTPEGLFFAADTKQSIYSRGAGWTAADDRLQFKGRTTQLTRNYRSTAEIEAAAFALLEAEPGEDEPQQSKSTHEGPLPVLLRGVQSKDEASWIGNFLRQMAKLLSIQIHASAVLVPDKSTGETMAKALSAKGVAARFFEGKTLNLSVPEVKVLTFHSAKGLEFPTVVVAGLHPKSYPVREQFEEDAEFGEALRHHRRLLYTACTRAMRGLMVIEPADCQDAALPKLQVGRWTVQEVK
jgi:superfamily I DNA/RNA helicase/mRNA-degrading endonuclease RelE of RelBE toxin-antitoxin system